MIQDKYTQESVFGIHQEVVLECSDSEDQIWFNPSF